MLEAAGFSRSNPYNIVPQGRVNVLTVMKDEQRLELLKDIAGTRIYDQRRDESLVIMQETRERRGKIDEMLGFIDTRLAELNAEKEELHQYQTLDKRRKVAEYAYYDKELRKAKAELEKLESKRTEDSEKATEQNKKEEKAKLVIKEADKLIQGVASELAMMQEECSAASDEQKKLVESVARIEMEVRQSEDDRKNRHQSKDAASSELTTILQQTVAVEKQVADLAPDCADKVAMSEKLAQEQERSEAQLQQLYSQQGRAEQFGSKQDRDKHLQKEIKALRAVATKKEQQAEALQKALEQQQNKAGDAAKAAEASKQRLAHHRQLQEEARTRCASLRQDRDEATDKRKKLWRKEQELQQTAKANAADLEKARRTLQHSMSRAQWDAVQAVKRIATEQRIQGVHGMLLELFTVDDSFFTAVEVVASNQLFQVVVDNDDIAARLMKELQKANAGRVTFMPLNRIRPGADPEYPDSAGDPQMSKVCVPMIKKMKFEPKFRPVIAQVFRKCLIVKDLEVGSRFSRSHSLHCVTIQGDQVNDKGALSGGYLDIRRSRLQAQLSIEKLSKTTATFDEQQQLLGKEVAVVDQNVTSIIDQLQREEATRQKAAGAIELETLELQASSASTSSSRDQHRAADAQKEKARAALVSAAQADHERLEALEAELASDFSTGTSQSELQQRAELQGRLHSLQRERVVADKAKVKAEGNMKALETKLSEHLQRRQRELEAELERLDTEATGDTGGEGGALARLEEARNRLVAADAAHQDLTTQREAKKQEDRRLQSQHDELKVYLAAERTRQQEEAKELDRLLSKKSLLQQKQEEFTDCIRKLGSLPKDAFEQSHANVSSKQLLAEIEVCHRELQKLGHVNKKALDQVTKDALVELLVWVVVGAGILYGLWSGNRRGHAEKGKERWGLIFEPFACRSSPTSQSSATSSSNGRCVLLLTESIAF